MPYSGPAVNGEINIIGPTSDVVGETLIFSPDLIKTDSFNPEDHVILVVPDSSDNLVTDCDETDGAQYITIPADGSPVHDDNATITVDPSQFGDALKPNLLFITELVQSSKLASELVGAKRESPTVAQIDDEKSSTVVEQKTAYRTEPSSVVKSQKQPKNLRNLGKCHSTKQETPEIFGKRFPASFNEVLFKKIREFILTKNGPNLDDDAEVPEEILCPHCRKRLSSLSYLKEHLYNCHTYVNKRKLLPDTNSPVQNKPKRPLHRCPECKAVFISSERMENHSCRTSHQVFECLGGAIHQNGCKTTPFGSDRGEIEITAVRSSNDENAIRIERPANLPRKSHHQKSSTASRPDTTCSNTPSTVKDTPKCLGCRSVLTGNFQICEKCLANAEINGDTIILECDFEGNETEDESVRGLPICPECKCSFSTNSTSISQTHCEKCSIDCKNEL